MDNSVSSIEDIENNLLFAYEGIEHGKLKNTEEEMGRPQNRIEDLVKETKFTNKETINRFTKFWQTPPSRSESHNPNFSDHKQREVIRAREKE